MKKIIALFILSLSICSVHSENLFQTNNPFPQTVPQTMNNIYESKPAIIKREEQKAKKSWFRRGKNLSAHDEAIQKMSPSIPVYPAEYEGTKNDGNFYVFTTGQ